MRFYTDGSEKARIDSSGRLLVGTSTALTNLSYEATSTLSPQIQLVGSNASTAHIGVVRTSGGGPADLTLGWGSSGNLAASNQDIGAVLFSAFDGTSYKNAAHIQCEADDAHASGDTPGRLVFSTTAAGASSPGTRMTINNSGNVTIAKPLSEYSLSFNGAVTTWRTGVSGNSGPFYVVNNGGTGVQLGNNQTAWTTASDERLKTNLLPIENGLDKVSTLRAVTGRYLTDEAEMSRSFLIAQDVQAVLPEAVSVEEDDQQTLGLRYTEVIPLLVSALKESKQRIEVLEAKVNALEGN